MSIKQMLKVSGAGLWHLGKEATPELRGSTALTLRLPSHPRSLDGTDATGELGISGVVLATVCS